MRQIAIALIVLLALAMDMASCSHESPVPFLEEMGINTDSLLVDSFPSTFDYKTQGTAVTEEQCDLLGLKKGQYKIVSVRNIKDNYLIFYCEDFNYLFSVLYNKEGKVLDRCNGIGVITPIKNKILRLCLFGVQKTTPLMIWIFYGNINLLAMKDLK